MHIVCTSSRLILILLAVLFAVIPAANAVGSDNTPQDAENTDRKVRRIGDHEPTQEWDMQLAVPVGAPDADSPETQLALPDPELNEQLQTILNLIAINPGDSTAHSSLDALLTEALGQANAHMDEGEIEKASRILEVVQTVNPQKAGLARSNQRLQQMQANREDLARARVALDEDRVVEPDKDNAFFYIHRVLESEPNLDEARALMVNVQQALTRRALDAARDFDFELADEWLGVAATIREPQEMVEEARAAVAGFLEQHAQQLESEAVAAIDTGQFDRAEFILIDLIALGQQSERVTSLRTRIAEARLYGGLQPGQELVDQFRHSAQTAPPLIIVAAGSFFMGSNDSERNRSEEEGPVHRITFKRGFAMGRNEVSVDEFRIFIEATGYQTQAERSNSSTIYVGTSGRLTARKRINWTDNAVGRRAKGNLPVLHVSWDDAQAYVDWLARETGKFYRLPSEAEFEYAMRGGSSAPYWWGKGSPKGVVENLTGDGDVSSNGREWSVAFEDYDDGYWGPAPVASFQPNPYGLFDMGGNVAEWVTDCWHSTYVRAPSDGSAWVNKGCGERVIRGGYWAGSPANARSAHRWAAPASTHGAIIGFRVARDL
jgi:formylglycine-generating enzyme required for sulfatase activity